MIRFDATVPHRSPVPGGQDEKPRNERRVEVRAKFLPGAVSCAWPGKSIRNGVDTDDNGEFCSTVYVSDCKRLQETKVEDLVAMWNQAQKVYLDAVTKHVHARMRAQPTKFRAAHLRPLPADRDAWTPDETDFAASYLDETAQGIFYKLVKRSVRPLLWIKIEGELEAPISAETQAIKNAVEVVGQVQSSNPSIEQLRALVEKLSAEVKQLRKDSK